ncbi:sugar ABC transporter permease [Paenibacillus sp. CGMCC 1.16610]|uniref:ABC transporter permease subunit n=1 Tax=Paenibacillus anseongense TaxID=2682845 RepID=A0ABW9U8I5_9BACL|nr:sugar ABC transporter permease [Paenibacillus sp. CGMCC 1.16610]MBA2939169.1 sugar ABC transporter permease [Paenibacillus sp. CGMCC 1.16610]MVQ35128.1 ABC transporter permease subunit [Paenibacillus anseongense]
MDIVLTTTKPAAAKLKKKKRGRFAGLYFVLPLLLFVSVFTFFGIFYNVYIGFFEWSGIGSKAFVGLDNYVSLLHDPNFYQALGNTFYFLVVTIPLSMALGLLLATLLNGVWVADGLFKSIFFLPHVIAVVTVGTTFAGIYEPNFGLLNTMLRFAGVENWAHAWLSEPATALNAIAAVYIFANTGFYMLIYYTSLLNIDQEIFEAAKIDGAGVLRQFRHIIFPMLSGTHITLLILGIIHALKVFDLIWIMTEGGPGGETELISTFLFRESLLKYRTGYSGAVSVVLLLIAFGYTAFQLRVYNKVRR